MYHTDRYLKLIDLAFYAAMPVVPADSSVIEALRNKHSLLKSPEFLNQHSRCTRVVGSILLVEVDEAEPLLLVEMQLRVSAVLAEIRTALKRHEYPELTGIVLRPVRFQHGKPVAATQ